MVWRLLLARVVPLLALAAAAGCAPAAGAATTLGPPRPSPVAGLPVPDDAELVHAAARSDLYRVPVGLHTLEAWYDRELPAAKPWRTWQWVDRAACVGAFRAMPGEGWAFEQASTQIRLSVAPATRTSSTVEVDEQHASPWLAGPCA